MGRFREKLLVNVFYIKTHNICITVVMTTEGFDHKKSRSILDSGLDNKDGSVLLPVTFVLFYICSI